MFSVLQNVFGKPKPEKGVEADEFVMVDNSLNDKKMDDTIPGSDRQPPDLSKNPYLQLAKDKPVEKPGDELNSNVLSIQDVPFSLNSSLNVQYSINKICHGLESCLASISQPLSLQEEYDFTLEKSVLAGTT